MRRFVPSGAWLLACFALAGCQANGLTPVRIDSLSGMYQSVTLNYRVDTGQLSEPVTVARIADRQVRQQQLPSSPYPDRSIAQLTVRYPHPAGKKGVAQAEVVIETRQPPRAGQAKKASWVEWADEMTEAARDLVPGLRGSDTVYEVWAMDLPRGELDLAIAGMTQSGYFIGPPRPTLGVELAAKVDNFQARKRWAHVPELDMLIDRVRQNGQLVSYQHPLDTSEPAPAVAANQASPFRTVAAHENEIQGPTLLPAGPQAYGPSSEISPSGPAPSYAPSPAYSPPAYTPPAYTPPALQPRLPPPASIATPDTQVNPSLEQQPSIGQPRVGQPRGGQSLGGPNRSPTNVRAQPGPRQRMQLPPQYRRQVPSYRGPQPGATQAPPIRSRYAPPNARQRQPASMQRSGNARLNQVRGQPTGGQPSVGRQAGGLPAGEPNTEAGRRSFWPRFGRPRTPRGPQSANQAPPNSAGYQQQSQ